MVNTFWTSTDPKETARDLDNRRLNKQVLEATQLVNVLQDIQFLASHYSIEYLIENIPEIRKKYLESKYYLETPKYREKYRFRKKKGYQARDGYRISKAGYWSHPASLMWFYHVNALKEYCNIMRKEHIRRGGKTIIPKYQIEREKLEWPYWVGIQIVQRSHRESLLAKEPSYYLNVFSEKQEFSGYFWPEDSP